MLARSLPKGRGYARGGGWDQKLFKLLLLKNNMMYLTQKNHIRCDKKTYKILRILTRLSKNLYNFTLYTVRQYYLNNGKYLPYEEAYHLVKHNENYKLLPSQVAQQTMKVADRNMRSFFHVLNERKKGNYNALYPCRNTYQKIVTSFASSRKICSR
ncbi:MAG: Transposase, IS605 OrfB family [Thermococcus sp. 40_45]|nr:MAG: Transposase, IS605 OrfB family [Thermococcus sp. 40_45]